MRPDMHKIIVERPRAGGGSDRRGRARIPLDDLPARESMRMSHSDRKSLTDNLPPLRRWLRGQVGRPWDKVYSEACVVIRRGSTVRTHLKTHLLEMVERRTFLRGGEVWCARTGWISQGAEIPVSDLAGRWGAFYVHPRSGLLCEARPDRRRPRGREFREPKTTPTRRWVNPELLLLQLRGCWFQCAMWPLPDDEGARVDDRASGTVLDRRAAVSQYGKPVFCVGKRQLSRAELRLYGLSNTTPAIPAST